MSGEGAERPGKKCAPPTTRGRRPEHGRRPHHRAPEDPREDSAAEEHREDDEAAAQILDGRLAAFGDAGDE